MSMCHSESTVMYALTIILLNTICAHVSGSMKKLPLFFLMVTNYDVVINEFYTSGIQKYLFYLNQPRNKLNIKS